MQKLRGEISAEEAAECWEGIGSNVAAGVVVDAQGDKTIDPMQQRYRCMHCC